MNLIKICYLTSILCWSATGEILSLPNPVNSPQIQMMVSSFQPSQKQEQNFAQYSPYLQQLKSPSLVTTCSIPYIRGRNIPPIVSTYQQFIAKYKCPCEVTRKSSDEYRYRQLVFQANIQRMNRHNSNLNRTYDMGLNKFADFTESEFKNQYLSLVLTEEEKRIKEDYLKQLKLQNQAKLKQNLEKQLERRVQQKRANVVDPAKDLNFEEIFNMIIQKQTVNKPQKVEEDVPCNCLKSSTDPISASAVDWSCISVAIKNQGPYCGCCYAIVATDTIEITYKIHQKLVFPLSFQELISCGTTTEGMYGCQGGYYDGAFTYSKNIGIGLSTFYPYLSQSLQGGQTPSCLQYMNPIYLPFYPNSRKRIISKNYIQTGDCNGVANVLQTRVVASAIASDGLFLYSSGSFLPTSNDVNHGVVLVGYLPGLGFKARNSWGNDWNNGYFYLHQESGVCDHAMYVKIEGEMGNPPKCPNVC